MNNIQYKKDYNKSTEKKYATNIPLLENFITLYTNETNTANQFFIHNNSSLKNKISLWIQMEHTLVLKDGRDLKNAPLGKIPSIYSNQGNKSFYHVRIDNENAYRNFNFVIEYSKANIKNISTFPGYSGYLNKTIYIPPMPFVSAYQILPVDDKSRNIDILTSYLCLANSKRREDFIKNCKDNIHIKPYNWKNITNIFDINKLKDIYDDSKIIINIHQTQHHHTLEEFRILPAIMRKVIIISEDVPCKEEIPYSNYVIWCNISEIPNKTKEVLENYELYFNELYGQSSEIHNILKKMYNDSYNNFKNKIQAFEKNNHISLNKNNIIKNNTKMSESLFDFKKFKDLNSQIEKEYSRLKVIEEKYDDLLEENKNLRKELKLVKSNKIPQSKHFNLSKSALDYGLDKVMRFKDGKHVFGHNFIHSYTKIFDSFDIDNVENLLEIGIGCLEKGQMGGKNGIITNYGYKTGNSLRMWRDYFINANIHGIDIFSEAMIVDEDRIHTYVCDQSSSSKLNELIFKNIGTKLDIVIDDGSHEIKHQVTSFETLSNHIKPGGLYIIECIQPKNIKPLTDLSAFKHPETFRKNFNMRVFDTRKDTNKHDDYMLVFEKK